MIHSVMQQGYQGMQQSQSAMLQHAQTLASARPAAEVPQGAAAAAQTGAVPRGEAAMPLDTLTEALVGLRQEQQLFDASAKVFELGDRALGSLLDTSA
jgi:hypothetical protein